MTRKITFDFDQLQAMREHHLQQLRRIDDAIALVKDIHKLSLRAEKTMGAVRERAAGDGTASASTTRYHADPAYRERQKASARARYQKTKHAARQPTAARSKRQREAEKQGTRPLDQARTLLAAANGAPVARETFAQRIAFPPFARAGQAQRIVGQVLAALTKSREVKAVADGYVATPKLVASVNGASA